MQSQTDRSQPVLNLTTPRLLIQWVYGGHIMRHIINLELESLYLMNPKCKQSTDNCAIARQSPSISQFRHSYCVYSAQQNLCFMPNQHQDPICSCKSMLSHMFLHDITIHVATSTAMSPTGRSVDIQLTITALWVLQYLLCGAMRSLQFSNVQQFFQGEDTDPHNLQTPMKVTVEKRGKPPADGNTTEI